MKKTYSLFLVAFLVLANFMSFAQIQLLTGTENGTYYQLAKDMAKLMPSTMVIQGQDTVEVSPLDIRTTAGSAFNFEFIADKDHPAKAAFMQFDYLLVKQMEDRIKQTTYTKDLVVLMPMNMEEIHLISKQDDDIHSLADIAGKNVAIGNKREGTYSTATYIQNVTKVNWHSRNISIQDAIGELIIDKIDAFFVVGSIPMNMLNIVPPSGNLKLELSSLENINSWADYYTSVTIPANTYMWQKADVFTYAVPSVIVVNMAKLSEEEIQQLKQWRTSTTEGLEQLRQEGHPAWQKAFGVWNNEAWPILE